MPEIKNKRYRQFLDTGEIDFINDEHIEKALNNIKHPKKREARALLIALYYTGARPAELLELTGSSIKRDGNDILIYVKGKKHGLPRMIRIPKSRKFMTELYNYSQTVFDNVLLFPHFVSKYSRTYINNKGEIIEAKETTGKLRHWIKKWFDFLGEKAPNTYFLRHNRFSLLAEKGASMADIKFIKGARTLKSTEQYTHMSTARAKKIKKYF